MVAALAVDGTLTVVVVAQRCQSVSQTAGPQATIALTWQAQQHPILHPPSKAPNAYTLKNDERVSHTSLSLLFVLSFPAYPSTSVHDAEVFSSLFSCTLTHTMNGLLLMRSTVCRSGTTHLPISRSRPFNLVDHPFSTQNTHFTDVSPGRKVVAAMLLMLGCRWHGVTHFASCYTTPHYVQKSAMLRPLLSSPNGCKS